ncbi:hypothetical protein, partial [Enterobacter hormaechei]|uniref:hypothetical protein n=1 Tax=Enterobacter hormaechei TaxID=158836 RepID=UPI003BE01523
STHGVYEETIREVCEVVNAKASRTFCLPVAAAKGFSFTAAVLPAALPVQLIASSAGILWDDAFSRICL